MIARATTTISILRGTEVDDWGEEKDTSTVVATGISASIIEQKSYNRDEVSTQPKNQRNARGRVTRGTDVRINDRIRDERTNQIWVIVHIDNKQNPVIAQDTRLDLQYVGMHY
jgi:hypothetical protein